MANQAEPEWSLTAEERADIVERVQANLASLAFSKGRELPEQVARAAAQRVEEKAYTVARVEARTTSGLRPRQETVRAYTRKLGQLALEAVEDSSQLTANHAAPSPAVDSHVLDLTGSRDFLEHEAAQRVFAPLLAPSARTTKVKLSTKSFSEEAAEVVAKALEAVSGTLLEADLSDIIAGRPEAQALQVLRMLSGALARCQLRALDLSDNALGEKGVRACAAALTSQTALERLAFQNVGCSINACRAVAELMPSTSQLRQLHLYNNMSDDEGAVAIAQVLERSPQMADFRMASSRVGAAGGIALARALASGGGLVRLDLSDNPMTGEVAPALAATLRRHPELTALNLTDTALGDDGISDLADALASAAPRLQELDLALNEVTAKGARVLAGALAGKAHLQRLNLRENELGDRGALALAPALARLPALRTLDLCQNQVRRGGALAVAKAVLGTPNLELLALDENEISEAGVDDLKGLLRQAGKADVLGPLDDNDPDAADDDDGEDEDEEAADGGDAGLSAALAQAGIN